MVGGRLTMRNDADRRWPDARPRRVLWQRVPGSHDAYPRRKPLPRWEPVGGDRSTQGFPQGDRLPDRLPQRGRPGNRSQPGDAWAATITPLR
jgi:hypothetical protein